jgi:para-nitrobenzyl esterase
MWDRRGECGVLDQPNVPFPVALNAGQQALAAQMRASWANFAATGNPSTATVRWPSFDNRARVTSLVTPTPQLETDFAARHHCSFWAAG